MGSLLNRNVCVLLNGTKYMPPRRFSLLRLIVARGSLYREHHRLWSCSIVSLENFLSARLVFIIVLGVVVLSLLLLRKARDVGPRRPFGL